MAKDKKTEEENLEEVTSEATVDIKKLKEQLMKEIMTEMASKPSETRVVVTQDSVVKGTRVISEEMKKEMARQEQNVRYVPFYDGDKYANDIFVALNGKGYRIGREKASMAGVMIPKAVKEILDESDRRSLELNKIKRRLDMQRQQLDEILSK